MSKLAILPSILILFCVKISEFGHANGLSTLHQNNQAKNSALDLILLHNNDLHGHFEENCIQTGVFSKCFGGFDRISTVVRQYRNDHEIGNGPPVVFLNAGDTYTGTPYFSLFKDKIASEMMNALMPDVATLGNHEFDHGVEGLLPFLNDIEFPIVAANLNISEDHPLANTQKIRPSTVLNIKGIKIGVIGYLLPETKQTSGNRNTFGVEFTPEIEAINNEAENLEKESIHIIIALGHSGYKKDQEIARDCPLVDIVVGGHSHTFLYSGVPSEADPVEGPYPTIIEQPSGKTVPVVQAYVNSKYLGELKLSFDKYGNLLKFSGAPILLDNQIARNPEVTNMLDKYRYRIDKLFKHIVGYTKVELSRNCTNNECTSGNLIADAFVYNRVEQYNGSGWTDASIAIVHSGGIRNSIPVGQITGNDLFQMLPFDDILMKLDVPGYILRNALQKSYKESFETLARGKHSRVFLHLSGARVVYNQQNHLIESLEVLCSNCSVPTYEKLVDHKMYGIVLDSFLKDGGDGLTMFEPFEGIAMNLTAFNATYKYIEQTKFVYPALQERIKFIDDINQK